MCCVMQFLSYVTNNANATELAEQLAMIHQEGRQDGLVFVGSTEHELLLDVNKDGTILILFLKVPEYKLNHIMKLALMQLSAPSPFSLYKVAKKLKF